MQTAFAFLKLLRIDSSLLAFLAVFLPIWTRTGALSNSLHKAAPIFFIAVCTFVANDLDDIERDKINHPSRALPSGRLAQTTAVILYFISLAVALLLTKVYIPTWLAFWYYALLVASISYHYIVEFSPSLKSPYVAFTSSLPIVIVGRFHPEEKALHFVAASAFLLILGRELCMDILDRKGDSESSVHQISPGPLNAAAMLAHLSALALLGFTIHDSTGTMILSGMVLLLVLYGAIWQRGDRARQKIVIGMMKFQLFLGLYFLV